MFVHFSAELRIAGKRPRRYPFIWHREINKDPAPFEYFKAVGTMCYAQVDGGVELGENVLHYLRDKDGNIDEEAIGQHIGAMIIHKVGSFTQSQVDHVEWLGLREEDPLPLPIRLD
tara:strand:- start:33604 stop:33951 length:348 start_codon:yes stop_codon:yes gene_type:complete